MTPWLVMLGAGRWQLAGIQKAKALGISVFALDGDAAAVGLPVADKACVADIRDVDAVLKSIQGSGVQPSGVMAMANDAGMHAAAHLRRVFDLHGPQMTVTDCLTNKAKQRHAWDLAGCPNPRWQLIDSQTPECELNHVLPAIVKPVDQAGSRGVHVVRQCESMMSATQAAIAASRCGQAILETYVPGTEYTVETFSHRGEANVLAVTSKRKVPHTDDTVAIELQTIADSPIRRSIANTAVNALRALGYTDGPGHTELIRRADGSIILIEAAGRGGGFALFDTFVPAVSGFDVVSACILQAVGMIVPEWTAPQSARGGATHGVLRFVPSQPGIVRRIDGVGIANAMPGVFAESLVEPGQHLSPAQTDGDRMALIIATADDALTAQERANRAEENICITVQTELS